MMPAQPNQSLIDGLNCLQGVASCDRPVGCRALARQMGLNPTRANRLLKTLHGLGMVAQDSENRYFAGAGIHVLSALSLRASNLLHRALPHLLEIESSIHVLALGLLWKNHVSYLFHGNVQMPLWESIGRVQVHPCTQSSLGMALLSQKKDGDIKSLLEGQELHRYAGIREVLSDCRLARQQGYAIVNFSRKPLNKSIGVAIDENLAIGISGAITQKEASRLIRQLLQAKEKIKQKINKDESIG